MFRADTARAMSRVRGRVQVTKNNLEYVCTEDKTGFVSGDSWSHAMEYEDEFAWSVQQFDNSVESSVVGDGRLSQDYDDIDYTSGNLVSFHTSLAR